MIRKRWRHKRKEAEDIDEVFDEIQSSPVMENLWKAYQRNYSYADDLFYGCYSGFISNSVC